MNDTPQRDVTVMSASETGNAKWVAGQLYDQVKNLPGAEFRLIEANDFTIDDLANEDILIMVTSTQGTGEPPYEAYDFYDALMEDDAPNLSHLTFAMLGLGDSMYEEDFNRAVRDFDRRFGELGGKRLLEHGECDIDFDEDAERWIAKLVPVLEAELKG